MAGQGQGRRPPPPGVSAEYCNSSLQAGKGPSTDVVIILRYFELLRPEFRVLNALPFLSPFPLAERRADIIEVFSFCLLFACDRRVT